MSDQITDTRNAARPNSARATGTRSAGGSSLACDNLAGWPVSPRKVHFVTYRPDSSSNPVAGTQLDCTGIVTANTIGSFTVIDGTDTGNSVNDVVEMIPTAAWGQDLADALTNQHTRTGAHSGITNTGGLTTDTLAATGNATVGGTLGVTGATTLTGAVGGTGYDAKTLANSYKFSVYLAGTLASGSTGVALITFDTKTYDTSSNYSTSTGKFTAPIAGSYHFTAISGMTLGGNTIFYTMLYKNGSEVKRGMLEGTYNNQAANGSSIVSGDIQLAANDFVQVYNFFSSTPANLFTGAINTYFDGFLISAT